MEIVHAKINPKAIESSRPEGERYDEVGTVLRDMIAFGIDIITDIHVLTPFAERCLGNDELRIVGGWRNQCVGARINGRIVPLRTRLQNGDIIEIVTQSGHKPSRDWLTFVATSRARSKIRHVLLTEERTRSIALGRRLAESASRLSATRPDAARPDAARPRGA